MALRQLIFLCLLTTILGVKLNKKFIKQVIDRHNVIRAEHGVNPLVESNKLSRYAQKWANKLAKRGQVEHRKNTPYGENLSFKLGPVPGKGHVNNLYIKEEKYYSDNGYYGTEPPMADFGKYGHFTQIVWKGSRKIGVGKAGAYVVINYQPAGNYLTLFKENVFNKT